ncbi:Signal transduction histidine kinase [Marinactinospora thermotolerans DSM 45154]|uniref:histidine kinase n=1 Tax=Marinactinospora thermotolerans DSM 45154 TaxID=1122192 RepID=A0A1T4T510_9ACTN|nr:ATP-binding protein [Marinactinospora thermotolerans]SKA35399.1 Signal transduction histidine kinase [Marinactinospora thermotolerans DSM 45154]
MVALYAELDEKSAQLREVGEAKDRFWAGVSHELRTPLNSVIGLTGLLADPAAEPLSAEQRYQVELIRDSARTLLGLVNELLDHAKAESGRMEPVLTTVELPSFLQHLRAGLRPLAEEAGIGLVVDLDAAPRFFVTDERMLERILRNLLSNGVKFTERGEVRLTVEPEGEEELVFTVCDTGVGIPAEYQERVFEEFFQAPCRPGEGDRARGTGLGLAYARRLAGLLGGDLSLTSTPGEGTRVRLRLPATRAPLPEAAPTGLVRRVLLVDDDPASRTLLRELVEGTAQEVEEAEDDDAALRRIRLAPPDAVVLRLHEPATGSRLVLRALERRHGGGRVPVVLIAPASLPTAQLAGGGAVRAVVDATDLSRAALADALSKATTGGS